LEAADMTSNSQQVDFNPWSFRISLILMRHKGGEDWDLWLCFAEEGKWGLTVPEIGYW